MASSSGLWDLSGATNRTMLPSGTNSQVSGGRSSSTTSSSQSRSGVSAVNTQNTPQFALNALEQLIAQLSDRPDITEAELDKIAPLPNQADFMRTRNIGNPTNPTYVQELDRAAYERALKAAQAKRQEAMANAGTIQGGTSETRATFANRNQEIAANRNQRSAYSKEAAFNDAGALSARFTRQLLEEMLPQITRATEASGTSGGAVRGLMAQDAAARVAEAQAALGLQASVQYGQVANQASGILELLTRSNNPTLDALMQAINLARGTVNQGFQMNSETSTGTQTSTENKQGSSDAVQLGINLARSAEQTIGGIPRVNANVGGNMNADTVNRPGEVITDDDYNALVNSGVTSRLSNFQF